MTICIRTTVSTIVYFKYISSYFTNIRFQNDRLLIQRSQKSIANNNLHSFE